MRAIIVAVDNDDDDDDDDDDGNKSMTVLTIMSIPNSHVAHRYISAYMPQLFSIRSSLRAYSQS